MVTINELRRVVFSKSRLLTLLILVLCSLLWQHTSGSAYRKNGVQAKYQSQLTQYSGMRPDAALEQIELICTGGDYMNALDFAYIRPQLEHLRDYETNIAAILNRAENMSNISIFAGSPYSRANIRKTAADFTRIQGLAVTMGNDLPIQRVLYNDLSDALACAFMLTVAYSFLAERKRGLWYMVCSSPNGRERLALWRFGSMAVAATTAGGVFTGVELLYAYTVHGGWQELGRYAQSVLDFADWTLPMTIGEMWALYLLLRITGLFVVGMIAWFLLELVADWRLVGTVWALVGGGEYLLTRMPEGNLLRHINLFSFAQPRKLITTYVNLNLFGNPTGQLAVLAIALAIAIPAMLAVIVLLYRCRKPVKSYRWLDQLLDRLRRTTAALGCHTSLLGHELHRTMVIGKGWMVCLVAFLVIALVTSPVVTPSQETDLYLESYYRQSQGPVTDDTDNYLSQCRLRLEEKYAQREMLLIQYAAGEINPDEYGMRMMAFSEIEEQEYALQEYASRLEELKQAGSSYILPHWIYEILLGYQATQIHTIVIISSVAMILLFTVQSSTERRTGMLLSRRATARGRKEIRLHRHIASWIVSGLFGICLWTMYLVRIWADYGELPWLSAPVRCLSFMEHISGNISIIGFYMLQTGLRTTFLCLIGSLTLVIMEVKDAYGN